MYGTKVQKNSFVVLVRYWHRSVLLLLLQLRFRLIGQVDRQPSLRVCGRAPLPPRVVLNLVPVDLADREVARLQVREKRRKRVSEGDARNSLPMFSTFGVLNDLVAVLKQFNIHYRVSTLGVTFQANLM